MKKLMILGAGGHGGVVADAAAKSGYQEIAFLDDGDKQVCLGYPVVGKTSDAEKYADWDFFVAIGNGKVREKVVESLSARGLKIVNVIHPSAIIGKGATMGKGVLLAAGAIISPGASLGDGVIVNTAASVDHDSTVEKYCHISAGARVGAMIYVKEHTFVGMSATIISGLNICADCLIGAGATVVKDLTVSGTYIGVPAKLK